MPAPLRQPTHSSHLKTKPPTSAASSGFPPPRTASLPFLLWRQSYPVWQLSTQRNSANLTEYPQCLKHGCRIVGELFLQQRQCKPGPKPEKTRQEYGERKKGRKEERKEERKKGRKEERKKERKKAQSPPYPSGLVLMEAWLGRRADGVSELGLLRKVR